MLGVALACAGAADRSGPPIDHAINPVIRAACVERERFKSPSDVVQSFGAPRRHKIELVENPHVAGQRDELHVIEFEQGRAQFIRVGSEPRDTLLQLLSVRSKGGVLRSERWLGASLDAFIEVAGSPDRVDGARHFYACDESDEFAVEVTGTHITAIAWYPYVD